MKWTFFFRGFLALFSLVNFILRFFLLYSIGYRLLFLKIFYLFIWGGRKEKEHEEGRGEGEADPCWAGSLMGTEFHPWNLSQRQMLNWLSHSGTSRLLFITFCCMSGIQIYFCKFSNIVKVYRVKNYPSFSL